MTFIDTLQDRGFVKQTTSSDFPTKIIPYIGFDLTADCLHVGSLIQLMVLRHAVHSGITPIVLLGGFTTKIGDPTGRSTSRPILSDEQIEINKNGIKEIIIRIVGENVIFVDNNDWMSKLSFTDFLMEFTRFFSVNSMINMHSIRTRLESQDHMSVMEFNYSLSQAIDFWMLNQKFDCNLQIGGSDQWGNITSGTNLIHKKMGKDNVAFGLTTPLLLNSHGEKMGKTSSGALWLSSDKFDVRDFWQFWRNVEDDKVEEFLKLFTNIPVSDLPDILVDINSAKVTLADHVTEIVHGHDLLLIAKKHASIFNGGDGEVTCLSKDDVKSLVDMVSVCAKVSKAQAKRLIVQGAVKIDDIKIMEDGDIDNVKSLQVGKKMKFNVELT